MFILEEPYVSDFCKETLKKNAYPILKTQILENENLNFISKEDFHKLYTKTNKLYTNSENSFEQIETLLSDTILPATVKNFKDKGKTRELLAEIFPDFFYKKISFEELSNLNPNEFKYPFVIKPSIGFLSFGVFTVWKKEDLTSTIEEIKTSMEKVKGVFPKNVLCADNFIIEEFIEGEEFAVDVYFNSNSKPVILNIYKHPFLDKFDVSDRLYITSSEIISQYLAPISNLFEKIGKKCKLKNFPSHIELRIKNDKITPIEINPLRFAGWCLCDLAYFAYGINPYEYFMEEKEPNWENIIQKDKNTYAFVMGEVPMDVDKNEIEDFELEKFKKSLNAKILDTRIYDFKTKPMFNSLFIKADKYEDIKHILNINTKDYIRFKK